MEVVLENSNSYNYEDNLPNPDLDKEEYWEFRLNFQKGLLISLLVSEKLTQNQYDCCVEMLERKYIRTMPEIIANK